IFLINANNYICKIYGISQNPNTKDYIIIIQDVYFSGNKKIDNFIQEMQLKRKSHNDIMFEWISYNQFSNIEEMCSGDYATIYSAIWKNGPLYPLYFDKKKNAYGFGLLYYDRFYEKYKRESDKQVGLICMHNSQNITNEFLDKVWDSLLIQIVFINNYYLLYLLFV